MGGGTWCMVLQLPSREQMEFFPPNPSEMAQDPPTSQPAGQSNWLLTKSTFTGGTGMEQSCQGCGKELTLPKAGNNVELLCGLGDVDLMGLGYGFMVWLLALG